MVIVNLGAWPLQVAVMIKQLQSPQELLRAAADERDDVCGTKKTMPMNAPDDVPITVGQLNRLDFDDPFETGKTDGLHPLILSRKRGQAANVTSA